MAELHLKFAQLLKSYVPTGCQTSLTCPPFESNTLELSNTLLCHRTWLSFLIQVVAASLLLNPPSELGVGRILLCDEAVAELHLEFAQLLKAYAPNGCQTSLTCPPIRIQHSRALEYAPLSYNLACLPDTTCSGCAASQPNSQAWGWQNTFVRRGSGRTSP